MADFDFRPSSLGELLDRAFSLYRRHFWLFVGINAVPQVFLLALRLAVTSFHVRQATVIELLTGGPGFPAADATPFGVAAGLFAASVVAGVFGAGGSVYAASEVYFGRPVSVRASLSRVRQNVPSLIGLWILRYGAAILGVILLVAPGIYWYCRTLPSLPAALLENLGPRDSLKRGWDMTKGFAGRAFLIYLLYFVLIFAIRALSTLPFTLIAQYATRDPEVARRWLELAQTGNTLAAVLAFPFFGIADYLFYFDLRVRKEALDLQLMLNPDAIAGAASLPAIFS